MEQEVKPLFMFPPVNWWLPVREAQAGKVSAAGRYQKGSLYNRYRIVAANGPLWLTVPLSGGRLQKAKVRELKISDATRWQHQHTQTMISAYGRAPFFEALWFMLAPLYQKNFVWLQDFNLAGLESVSRALRLCMEWEVVMNEPDITSTEVLGEPLKYRQVFEERHGFQEDISILDLLFCNGTLRI